MLDNPAPHVGNSYRPTGPELLSPQEVAAILTKVVGRNVAYRDVSIAMFAKAATAQGFPLEETSQVRYYAEELRRGAFEIGAPTDHVEAVTGQKPERFADTARRYLQRPELIHPRLTVGSKFQALVFMMRMMLTRVPDLLQWERERGHPLLRHPVLAPDSAEWRTTAARHRLNLLPIGTKYAVETR